MWMSKNGSNDTCFRLEDSTHVRHKPLETSISEIPGLTNYNLLNTLKAANKTHELRHSQPKWRSAAAKESQKPCEASENSAPCGPCGLLGHCERADAADASLGAFAAEMASVRGSEGGWSVGPGWGGLHESTGRRRSRIHFPSRFIDKDPVDHKGRKGRRPT